MSGKASKLKGSQSYPWVRQGLLPKKNATNREAVMSLRVAAAYRRGLRFSSSNAELLPLVYSVCPGSLRFPFGRKQLASVNTYFFLFGKKGRGGLLDEFCSQKERPNWPSPASPGTRMGRGRSVRGGMARELPQMRSMRGGEPVWSL